MMGEATTGTTNGTSNASDVVSDEILTHTVLYARVAAFLRAEDRAYTRIDLVHVCARSEDHKIRSWDRQEVPSLFDVSCSGIEVLAFEILRTAFNHAETLTSGIYWYEIWATRELGDPAKFGFRIQAQDRKVSQDVDNAGEAPLKEPRGPFHLSLHCDGIDLDVNLTAEVRQKTGAFIDQMSKSLPQFMSHLAPAAFRSPGSPGSPGSHEACEAPHPPLAGMIRTRLGMGSLSAEDLASVSDILFAEHERRRRRGERAGVAIAIGDLVEDHLAIFHVTDQDLLEAIDLLEMQRVRSEGAS